MSTTRLHHHPSLPAPVVHAGFSAHQSKSHVLAGVQDAYWSDDDADDADCPLCLEEMDISDLNFKPCVCGYQICRFCWHHIKQNLNGRCPACRREYTDETVQFKPIAKEDHKRLTQQKKQRERERKELDALGRRHLANVRVVQRNVVYVVGIGPRFAKEELIPTLRSNDYFGQYGKISKILLVKRTSSGGGAPIVGLYITYHRREDAARCISTVDGAPSPGGGREVMRASYGTTKYCMAFLRSISCTDHTCMNLHEWGDEKDCFTKEDLTTLKHTIKDTESRGTKNGDGLPRTAAWAKLATPTPSSTTSIAAIAQRPRRGGQRQARTPRPQHDRKAGSGGGGSTKTPSIASSSRPPTPAVSPRPPTPPEAKTLRAKELAPLPPTSPSPSMAVDSDVGSGSQEVPPSPARPRSTESVDSIPAVPASLPPGLPDAPPGLPPPTRTPKTDPAPTPGLQALQMSVGSYQMSTAAQALLDDVKARREAVLSSTQVSVFPDFDRTLRMLSGSEGGFSFNLDPKLADVDVNAEGEAVLNALEAEARVPFSGGFMDAFPALKPQVHPHTHQMPTIYPHNPARSIYDPHAMRESYLGSFNPFGETEGSSTGGGARSSPSYPDEERKVSRFGFARGRQGSTAASSPVHVSSPLSASDSHHSFFTASETPALTSHWSHGGHGEYAGYATSSPLVQQAQTVQSPPQQHAQPQAQPTRFQSFDTNVSVSEAQLRELIQSSRERAGSMQMHNATAVSDQPQYQFAPFSDPAIMSARFASPVLSSASPSYASTPAIATAAPVATTMYGPPPGLSYPNITPSVSSSPSPVPALSSADFPALNADVLPPPDAQPADASSPAEGSKEQAKAERKAAKKAVAAERALERQKAAQEKAAAKATEKARIAQEKALEKEKLAKEKEEREKLLREKAEMERVEKEMQVREKAAEEEKERAAIKEKERQSLAEKTQAEKARAAQAKAQKAAKSALVVKATKSAGSSGQVPATATAKQSPAPSKASESTEQAPILSKMPKKNKPVTRPIKIPKEDEIALGDASAAPSTSVSEAVNFPPPKTTNTVVSSSNNSRAQSVDTSSPVEPTSLADLLDDIDVRNPSMDLPNHPFFDIAKINPAAKMPLEYGPLVHALSALSVGGGSFATNMPSGSIDNAVSSFQQLLETLTQTISDLLRLLPRTTWDDSSSFDGVLRDMLKGDDFLDDGGDDAAGKEDEVAALTLALERRARWMEVQLSKLEELHRDINTAAVRAVLAFNDSGWDRHIFMPRVGNTLRRFDNIGMADESDKMRPMTVDELEKKLQVAKEAAIFAETEFREAMEKMQAVKPVEVDGY
ncbi:hypothetical protein EV702DRAFT_1144308 [Suillus placidus]|uniref:RING-type domain-containing protein n=1 Tax=Suillus placidus TaxID=48579 RepID=A0A9P6ZJ97_9AGAM|nr:hypothetical protein EV702DRAFT_1144308 [Suillus placidus]